MTPNPDGADGFAPGLIIELDYTKCPNPKCRKPTLQIAVKRTGDGETLLERRLVPASSGLRHDWMPK